MSGLELIVAALAAGASAGVTTTATAAVQDAYAGLKTAIGRRLGRDEARVALEVDETDADVWRTRLGDDLIKSGIAEDEHILALAQALLVSAGLQSERIHGVDVRHAKGVQVGDLNFQSNTFN